MNARLKEKGVDLTIMTWRGIVAPKKLPKDVLDTLSVAAKKTAEDPEFKAALAKMNLTHAYLDAPAFKAAIDKDNVFFKTMMTKLGIAK